MAVADGRDGRAASASGAAAAPARSYDGRSWCAVRRRDDPVFPVSRWRERDCCGGRGVRGRRRVRPADGPSDGAAQQLAAASARRPLRPEVESTDHGRTDPDESARCPERAAASERCRSNMTARWTRERTRCLQSTPGRPGGFVRDSRSAGEKGSLSQLRTCQFLAGQVSWAPLLAPRALTRQGPTIRWYSSAASASISMMAGVVRVSPPEPRTRRRGTQERRRTTPPSSPRGRLRRPPR